MRRDGPPVPTRPLREETPTAALSLARRMPGVSEPSEPGSGTQANLGSIKGKKSGGRTMGMSGRADEAPFGDRLPGFGALSELGFSDVLRTFVQGIGRADGWGYALRTDGTVWKWESRDVLVGNGFEPVRFVTKQLSGLEGVTQLAGNYVNGSSPRFALQADGTVPGWGEDLYDELGLGPADFDTPVQQMGLANVRSLVATVDGAARLALTQEGEVWGWGSNYFGHLGDGTTADIREPQRIPGLEGITEVVVGSRCLALQSTGEVWTWARTFGEEMSGDEASDALLRPTKLAGIPPIASLFVDAATAEDGSFWMWDDQLTPSKVPGLSDVSAVVHAAGPRQPTTHHALKTDGTVWGWGGNEAGQIGDGTTIDRSEPVIVEPLSDVTDIVGAFVERYALTRSGEIYRWGSRGGTYDDRGELVWNEPLATPRLTSLPPANAANTFDKWMSIPPSPEGPANVVPPSLFDPSGGKTHLMHYAVVGTAHAINELIQQGADVNAVDDDGDTALYYALSRDRAEIVDLLLDHGADPNITGRRGNPRQLANPLQVAADHGWNEVVSSLLRHGADINRQGSGGVTAAMLAAGAGHTEALRTLCAAGADLDLLDVDGDSVLFYAASRGRVEAVRLLLEQGMDPNPRPGASGQTPLSIATILSTTDGPLPPGTTRFGLAAAAQLLTQPLPVSPQGPPASAPPGSASSPTSTPPPDSGPSPSAPGTPVRLVPREVRAAAKRPDKGGCYVATAVYGAYDCPEVWVLRRWRDTCLASTAVGRQFIHVYYGVSPTVVSAVGSHAWFTGLIRRPLDRFVGRLQAAGYSSFPYSDS